MKRLALMALLVAAVLGCKQERQILHLPPSSEDDVHRQDQALPSSKDKPITDKATGKAVEIAEDVDLARYGIDLYPGAKIDKEKSPGLKAKTKDGQQLLITMETDDSPRQVIEFYKKSVKEATTAIASGTMGGLQGTTTTGNAITVTVINFDDKNIVVLKIKT